MRDKAHGAPRHSMKPVAWYLPLLVALVVGCGGAQEAQQTGTGGATAEPKVKLLIMGVAPPVRDFSAMRHGGQPDSFQYRPHYEHLIGIDPKTGGYTPQLATEWTLQPDGLSYRFKLRQGVRFQGTWGDMTAKDVVHTYQQLVRPDSEHGQAFSVRRDVSAVEPVNDHEVIFRLSRPDLGFLSTASEQQSMFPIQSKAHFDTAGEPAGPEAPYIAGTGPYQFKARAQGSYIRFERVPYQHWRILPDFPEFEYRYLKEPSTRLATLLTGEVHVTNLPVDLQPQAVQAGMKIIQGPVPALRTWLNFACCWADLESGKYPVRPESPLLDVRVRRALSKAIDRSALNKAFFANKAEVMHLNHWNPTRLGWNAEWERQFADRHGYDPQKARALLAEAGYGAGKPLQTNIFVEELPFYSGAPDVVEAVAGYWRQIGVQVELPQWDRSRIVTALNAGELWNHLRISGSSSDQALGFPVWSTPIYAQFNRINIPEVTQKTQEVLRTLNLEKQTALWRELGEMAYERHMDVPLFWLRAEAVVNPSVVADYVFPGSITSTWTHPENIKAVK